jgi:ankyrin repeat protein
LQIAVGIPPSEGNKRIIRMLVEHMADIHFRDNQGETAIESASRNGYDDIAAIILRAAGIAKVRAATQIPLPYAGKDSYYVKSWKEIFGLN